MIQSARNHAFSLSELICWAYTLLNGLIVRHEGLIRKRWAKKTILQRREVLVEACGTMLPDHGSNIAIRRESFISFSEGETKRQDYPGDLIWPYINIEDLTKPKSLLIYLNSRARNLPWTFAANEAEFSPHGILTAKCPFKFKKGASLRFGPELDPHRYGEVRNDHCCSEKLATDHFHADLVEGLQILEIQAHIMYILGRCCRLIIQDLEVAQILSAPVQDEPPSLEILPHDGGNKSFSDALVIAPYVKRRDIDLQRLKNYVDAVYDETKDHVFSLREDPAYFADVYAQVSEHRPEHLPIKNGCQDRFYEIRFPMTVLTTLVSDAYEALFLWHEITTEVDNVILQFDGQDEDGSFRKLRAILKVEKLLNRIKSLLLHTITFTARASPAMRRNYRRRGMQRGNGRGVEVFIDEVPISHLDWERGQCSMCHLFLRLNTLHAYDANDLVEGEPHQRLIKNHSIYGDTDLYTVMDYIDTLSRNDKAARDMLTPHVSSLISQLSIALECAKQIKIWARSITIPMNVCLGCETARVPMRINPGVQWMSKSMGNAFPGYINRLVDPAQGKVDYPAHKPRTFETVQVMRQSEANLDDFWRRIDLLCRRATGIAQYEVLQTCLKEAGKIQRTLPWGPRAELEGNVMNDHQPFSANHDASRQITGQFDCLELQQKVKTKTRGSADSKSERTDEEHDAKKVLREADPEAHVIAIDKRTHKVFKAFFRAPVTEQGEVPKAVKWDEFERAMVRVGFSAEKLQGSAWQFVPSDKQRETRSIQFHEPHPDNDIPFSMARRFGRRLERVYGWSAKTFKLS